MATTMVTVKLGLGTAIDIADFCERALTIIDVGTLNGLHARMTPRERRALKALASIVSGPVSGAHPLKKALESESDYHEEAN